MEGRGVTNFSVSKPSHGFSTSTTEFDDELIKRGIVTTEQAMMAKGASAEDAIRLAQAKKRGKDSIVTGVRSTSNAGNEKGEAANGGDEEDVSDDDSFEDDFDDDDDDDAFMQRYRQQRLDQLKKEEETKKEELLSRSSQPASVLRIRRENWLEAVNLQSNTRWVVVTMTEASGERRDRVVQELYRFSREYNPMEGKGGSDSSDDDDSLDGDTAQQRTSSQPPRLLTIDASEAIPNWPEERVPAMFAYRNGVKQHEWIAGKRGEFPSRAILEQLFRQWKVI
jgi:hypothetical protein